MRYEFIESAIFSRYLTDYLTDVEYAEFQQYLCERPDAGNVVRGSGGVRKVRWALPGRGKSGGARVCYYLRPRAGQILLLTIYAKNTRASIPGYVLKAICEELENDE